MAEVKAIETEYNGYRFRSRLEARWAVFFDAAGIKYEYEQEGYECDGEKYLPDFYLPDFDIHIEVKPDRPGFEKEILKCMKMIRWGGDIKTIVFLGNIPPESDGGHWHFPALYYQTGVGNGGEVLSGWWFFQDRYDDNDNAYVIGHITSANYRDPFFVDGDGTLHGRMVVEKVENGFGFKNVFLNPSTEAVSDRILKKKDPVYDVPPDVSAEDWFSFLKESTMNMNSKFYDALKKARQSRFEHGECG